MANTNVKNKLESAISKLVTFQPLYGEVFLHLNKKERKDIPTLAVGVIRRVDLALYYNPDFITPDGKVTIEGYCTDIVTDMGIEFLKNHRDASKPFLLMVQHKAPHRCWMPALRHLHLYDDIEIPEPATLFDDYSDNAPPARFQELEIDRHMDPHYDLFLDLVPDVEPQAIQARQDKSAWRA